MERLMAWTHIQSAATKTLMPFLYHTKTLSRLRTNDLLSSRLAVANTRRCVHSSNIPISRPATASKFSNRANEPSSICGGGARSSKRRELDDDIPWDGASGVVGKGRKPFINANQEIKLDDGEEFEDMNFSYEIGPFSEDAFYHSFDELEASSAPLARESTITISERHAFERIFADIMARSRSTDSALLSPVLAKTRPRTISTGQIPQEGKAEEMVKSIMQGALKSIRRAADSKSLHRTRTRDDLKAAVDQYPLPLRAAAAKALGVASGRSPELIEGEEISNADELENTRQPERERVEGLMRAARTDVELWQVMEEEVFALVDKLGLGENHTVQKKSKKYRVGRKKSDASGVEKSTGTSTGLGDQPLDLNIYGPLYPSHALLGLRLLDRSFAKPSPLVLNVLPRIKSLGVISQVLGASTPLYNELLRIYWFRYDNFLGVTKFLDEMDQAGLEFDEETFSIVNDIYQMQLKVRKGDKGSVLQALWSMPKFAPGKFGAWREKIQRSIQERAGLSDMAS